jgi:simple sugar transport system permease protein
MFGVPFRDALFTFASGSAGSTVAWSETILKSVPLLMTALSVLIAFRAGVWNIGGEGQFIVGGIAALLAARYLPAGAASVAGALVAGALAGGAWALIAALLRTRRDVPEVVSTILLNFIAIHVLGFCVNGPLQESARQYPQSEAVEAGSWLPQMGELRMHGGALIALAVAIGLHLLLTRTTFGLRLRATGSNPPAARMLGIDVNACITRAFLISGAIAGAGGAIELLGVTHRLYERFAVGYGYSGITAALLAELHPLGAIASSLFLGALRTGGGELQRAAGVSASVTMLAEGVVILALLLFGTIRLALAIRTPRSGITDGEA